MKPEEAFGAVLKQARAEKSISQEQLALSCDLDRTFISMLERGQRQPSLSSILAISKSLEITAQNLIKLTTDLIDEHNKHVSSD
ncbi:helix-turn-helix domain-containing protein [Aliiglaciecola sp. M165]|uniref:helix-turn-helix domain-containing protein n=1 Tax=Aliiglaciecola sp. M165 TaxID=2593649 RepID=UPI001180A50D|nr:helix-turn-helix transcriptional regulator [Aliiglaciecola sp. M165]TRY31042.1 helix-turn-helix transcriptional regulator [Aliiglaciecola sp. M165]